MVRVATLLKKFRAGIEDTSPDGLSTDRGARGHPQPRAGDRCDEQTALLDARRCGRCWPPRASTSSSRRLHAGHRRLADRVLRGADLPGAHAAGVRPGPPVPVHLEPQHEPRGASCATAAARSSPASRCRTCCRGSSRCPPAWRRTAGTTFVFLEDVIRAQHPGAVPRHAGRRRAPLPHHPRHRHGDPGGRGRRPARDRRPQPEAAALRRAVAAAGRSRHAAARARTS